jgi:hypothetical protein
VAPHLPDHSKHIRIRLRVQDQEYSPMTTNVLPMEVARKPPRAKSPKPPAPAAAPKAISPKTARRITWQRRSAALLGTIAAAMTTVSLSHIAGGVGQLTHDAVPAWQCWMVSIGLDLNYVTMELAGVVAVVAHVRDRLHRLTRWGIPAVMGFSMALNALEFSEGATNAYELAAGVAMGVILPALVVFLTFRVAAVLADV